jgi:predicted nucleotidyltransferase
MTVAADYPSVTNGLLERVVEGVLSAGDPQMIVLFGSRARGQARPDSDLDLLIIEESRLPRYKRSPRYYLALAEVFPSKDIMVYTPAEVKHWAAVPNAFVTTALREGKVLYVRPS